MKRIILVILCLGVAVGLQSSWSKQKCATIQQGSISYSAGHHKAGQSIEVGYDEYGYNYQASRFRGSYANAYLGGLGYPPYEGDDDAYLAANPGAVNTWVWPYRDVELTMEWNNAWLSNSDCDNDGKLDRHHGFPAYKGSGAWTTNHMKYDDGTGKDAVYFVKIVAVPADVVKNGGIWYTADGQEIGPDIWGEFAIVQEVESGSGKLSLSPAGAGLGQWKP